MKMHKEIPLSVTVAITVAHWAFPVTLLNHLTDGRPPFAPPVSHIPLLLADCSDHFLSCIWK